MSRQGVARDYAHRGMTLDPRPARSSESRLANRRAITRALTRSASVDRSSLSLPSRLSTTTRSWCSLWRSHETA
eukprot:6800292-Prymnesium_polylepis.2